MDLFDAFVAWVALGVAIWCVIQILGSKEK